MVHSLIAFLATLATFGRVALTIVLGIVLGWFLGYAAAKSGLFERVFLSITQTLEAVPVITFFPIVLVFFVKSIGGYVGTELAVDFLVFTAVVWNIWVGEYEAIKTAPPSHLRMLLRCLTSASGVGLGTYIYRSQCPGSLVTS